jgi:hypothetical protein
MFVSSAAVPIETKPAMAAEMVPTIQTGRLGEWCSLVTANQPGRRPSPLMEYQMREAPE